jgi:hypothetical protein
MRYVLEYLVLAVGVAIGWAVAMGYSNFIR